LASLLARWLDGKHNAIVMCIRSEHTAKDLFVMNAPKGLLHPCRTADNTPAD
jgi:hypothetical protein